MKAYLIKYIILFLILLLIIGSTIAFLLNTNQGLRFSLLVAAKVTHSKLTAQKIDGCLSGSIAIEKLAVENKKATLFIDKLHLKWNIYDLLSGKLNINSLQVIKLKINTPAATEIKPQKLTLKEAITNLKSISLPFLIKLNDLQVNDILWQQGAYPPTKIENIVIQLDVEKENINSLRIEAHAQDSSFLLQGTAQQKWAINWQLHITSIKAFLPMIYGSFTSKGNIYGERSKPKIDSTVKIERFKCASVAIKNFAAKSHTDLTLQKHALPKINIFNIDIETMPISFPISGKAQSIVLNHGSIQGLFNDQGFFLNVKLLLAKYSPINIEVKLPKLTAIDKLYEEQPISGSLTWEANDLTFLSVLLPEVKDIQGSLKTKYIVSGTLQNPKLIGETLLYSSTIQIHEFNLKLHNTKVNLRLDNDKIRLQGVTHSGKGSLNLVGEVTFLQNNLNSKLSINGINFLATNTPQYQITISPQLILQINNDNFNLSGNIFIPQALLKLGNLNTNDMLPNEVVFVKKEKNIQEKKINLYTNIQIKLGDDVNVDIMDLKGKIRGQIQFIDNPQKIATATGALYIKNGSYNLYGQQLKVTKGTLHFFGGAATNPEVDIEAVRQFKTAGAAIPYGDKELTVGVRMNGMLDNAKTDLFSMPDDLSKPDILSYLVIGKSSDQASGSAGQLLFKAANALNLGGAGDIGNFLNDLRDRLGFSEFGLGEEASRSKTNEKAVGSVTTSTVFVLGKFLTPKIFISYSMGLLDTINIFRIKYFINKHWSIQSENSITGSGVDLFYGIEHN